MTTSEHLEWAVRSLRDPIEKFLQDGIWHGTNDWNQDSRMVGGTQVRAIGREIARLHKRPFIRYEEIRTTDELGFRVLVRVNIVVPRQKRLVNHITPLLLCKDDPTGETIWTFKGIDPDIWKKLLRYWLTDPDLRAARNAPPL